MLNWNMESRSFHNSSDIDRANAPMLPHDCIVWQVSQEKKKEKKKEKKENGLLDFVLI
jgi:hypothetical protein